MMKIMRVIERQVTNTSCDEKRSGNARGAGEVFVEHVQSWTSGRGSSGVVVLQQAGIDIPFCILDKSRLHHVHLRSHLEVM